MGKDGKGGTGAGKGETVQGCNGGREAVGGVVQVAMGYTGSYYLSCSFPCPPSQICTSETAWRPLQDMRLTQGLGDLYPLCPLRFSTCPPPMDTAAPAGCVYKDRTGLSELYCS